MCVSLQERLYVSPPMFTGDALFVRGCGCTDFQGGDSAALYQSVHKQIFSLPEDTLVYPGHDYRGRTCTTVGEEKLFNPQVTITESEFIEIMANLNLAYPKKIDASLRANLNCGYPVD
jgi:sulfur dioxygenase